MPVIKPIFGTKNILISRVISPEIIWGLKEKLNRQTDRQTDRNKVRKKERNNKQKNPNIVQNIENISKTLFKLKKLKIKFNIYR